MQYDDETKTIQRESFKLFKRLSCQRSPLTFRYLSRQIEAFNPMSPQGIFVYQCSIKRTMLNYGVIVCNHYNLCQYFCIHLKDVVLKENVKKMIIFLLKQNLYLS